MYGWFIAFGVSSVSIGWNMAILALFGSATYLVRWIGHVGDPSAAAARGLDERQRVVRDRANRAAYKMFDGLSLRSVSAVSQRSGWSTGVVQSRPPTWPTRCSCSCIP